MEKLFLAGAGKCEDRLICGKIVLDNSGMESDCADLRPDLPRLQIPFAADFQGQSCSDACKTIDGKDRFLRDLNLGFRASENICRICLKEMFGATHSGRPTIPTTADLQRMTVDSNIIGRAACLRGLAICENYLMHWKEPSAVDALSEDVIFLKSEEILQSNRKLADERGFGEAKLLIVSSGETFRNG